MTSRIAARSAVVLMSCLLLGGCARASETGAVQLDADQTPAVAAVDAVAGAPAGPTSRPVTSSPEPTSEEARLTGEAKKQFEAEKKKLQKETTITMPNLLGMTVQAAQDLMQSKRSYLMHQVDATGQHRPVAVDTDWQVCSQDPAASTRFSVLSIVTVRAVKLTESCP